MKLKATHNFADVVKQLTADQKQVKFATAVALNATAQWSIKRVGQEMRQVFNRPTRYVLRALRLIRADARTNNVQATLWFKDKSVVDSSESMIVPHVEGGDRIAKAFETRMQRIGILPKGWLVVPGAGADLDANGNMSRGQISLVLNILGAYTEAGYNKANAGTKAKLAAGNAKQGRYGFTYWVNPINGSKGRHLPPGVYKRIATPFGSSLKPVMIFVRRARYRKRLDFYGVVQREFDARFPVEFDIAYAKALATAKP